MKNKLLYWPVLLSCLLNTLHISAQSNPFDLYLEPLTINSLPGVQSYAYGQYNGYWLIAGGRLDGLHKAMGMGMMGTPFPASGNNNQLIVVSPATQQVYTSPLTSLAVDIQEQMSSTNAEFFQEGNYLYLIGGYGYSSAASKHITFSKLIAVDLPGIINAIIAGNSINSYIRQINDPEFQVTGGELEKIDDVYYLVGGHNFDGTYHHMMGMGMFTQTYTNQLRKFRLSDNGTNINITHLAAITDTLAFHRRDYNVVKQIMPDGKQGLTAFSGVFQVSADIPYLNCVNIDSNGYSINNSFSQYYNHYQCANLPVYSAAENQMHTLFFGGIAQYFDSAGVLTQDNNVPFVKTIARVSRDANGVMSEYKLPVEMPSLLGAGSELIPADSLPIFENGVLKLDDLSSDTTLVGYIYGGISSPQANVFTGSMMGSNGTSASAKIFKVYLVKNQPATSVHELNKQSQHSLQLQVSPNPNDGTFRISYFLPKPTLVDIFISDATGRMVSHRVISDASEGQNLLTYRLKELQSGGVYNICIETAQEKAAQRVIVHP